MIEIYGTLTAAFESLVDDAISPKTRRYLSANKAVLQARLQEFTVTKHCDARLKVLTASIVRNDEDSWQACKDCGFPSLGRLLKLQSKVELIYPVRDSNHAYVALVDQAGLSELERIVSGAEICAVDTESTDKDPRKAVLLGVAFSVSPGQTFYVPVTAADLRGVSIETVMEVLRRLLGGNIKFVGHNLKYDYVLLGRNGIRIHAVYFDTMLAAYECFGDWDFFNLGAVAKKLIGRDVKRYRDIIDEGHTLQDIPFKDLVEHGCADADAALSLYGRLRQILCEKGIDEQFTNEVMPLIQLLGDKELDGVRIDIRAIMNARDALAQKSECTKDAIYAQTGKQFDIDSMQEISTAFHSIEEIRDRIGRQPLRQAQLEQLAQKNELAHSIMQYRRLQKQIRQLDAICKNEKDGKVFPIFSQVKATHGSISSSDPSLFELESGLPPVALLDKDIRQCIPDANLTLDRLQQLTGDMTLENDRQSGKSEFIGGNQPSLIGLRHADVLVCLAIGGTNAALCKRFLISARRASDLREELFARYPKLFVWFEEYRRKALSNGFASSGDRRRYWDGLGSSDIDKRNKAQRSAVRWLIGM